MQQWAQPSRSWLKMKKRCIFDKGQTSVPRWSMGRSWKIYGSDRTSSVFASSASFADHLPVLPSRLFGCMLKRTRMSQDGPRLLMDRILFFFTRFVFPKNVQSKDEIEFRINNTLLYFIIIIIMIIVLMLTRRDDKSLFVSCFCKFFEYFVLFRY